MKNKSIGICYLVGGGPGDIGLVTLKAKECIENADVLIYDALSNPELIRWPKKDCEKIYAGKRATDHAIPQEGINALIVEKTQEGKNVVRLKGGDPMIFGRGGEEAAELAEAGVAFEIVPGISSAIAGPAYAGIPVTHRDHCSQLTLFTGHEDPTKDESSIDYEQIAKAPGTKVFLMGVARLRQIMESLITGGAKAETPIALTRWATTGQHRSIVGTIETIAAIAEEQNFKSPAVAVIGDVVKEREKISWFEKRPLFGKKVVVTRTREQASALSKDLFQLGADVLEIPTIRIEHPDNKKAFAQGVADVHTYDWLIFTSPNGAERFFDAFYATYKDARSLGGCRIAAIGPGTAKKIAEYRFTTDLIPERHVAEGLVETFAKEYSVEHQTCLWVKAEETRDVVGEGLTALGAIVDECISYKTVMEDEDPTGAVERYKEEGADVITFTSSSTVDNFFKMGLKIADECKVISIGPVTSETLRMNGILEFEEAEDFNIPGLVAALRKTLEK